MSRRRSHPPRARKGRNADSEAPPQHDSGVILSQPDPVSEIVRGAAPASSDDEMAALDAGWDEIAS